MTDAWSQLSLTKGALSLDLLPGIGGRLWDVRYGEQSLLFQNPDLVGVLPDLDHPEELPTKSPQFGFPLWGGEKTWIAPDREWPICSKGPGPHPHLDSGCFDVLWATETGASLQSPICPISQLQVERAFEITSDQSWTVRHRVWNRGSHSRFCGIWSVMMIKHSCQIGLDTGSDMLAQTVFGNAGTQAAQLGQFALFDCSTRREFKMATDNPMGRVLLRCGPADAPLWLRCLTPPIKAGDVFAHGSNFEVFNSGDYKYAEAEWHAPAQTLMPGAKMQMVQRFEVAPTEPFAEATEITLQELELMTCMS